MVRKICYVYKIFEEKFLKLVKIFLEIKYYIEVIN